jgi:phosphoenolpyruvate-protein phosphotransferase
MINILKVFPPLNGILYDITKTPDEAFAMKVLGDGVAVDPLSNKIYAPVSGRVKFIYRTKHAIIISSNSIDVLIHIGLETVKLNGVGFSLSVKEGDSVKCGDVIGEFDIDYVATNSKSLISPVIVLDLDPEKFKIKTNISETTDFNVPIFEIIATNEIILNQKKMAENLLISDEIIVLNPQGIHARPASQIASKVKELKSDVYIEKDGAQINAKSIVEILGLAINQNDKIRIKSSSKEAIDIITSLIIGIKEDKLESVANLDISYLAKVEDNKYYGVFAVEGLAIGKFCYKKDIKFTFTENCDDYNLELDKLVEIYDLAKNNIKNEIKNLTHGDMQSILSSHLELLDDPVIYEHIVNVIKENKTIAFAISKVLDEQCEKISKLNSKLIVERQSDLKDIKKRLLLLLDSTQILSQNYDEKTILVAEDFTPSEIISLNKNIVGLVSVKGGTTSHVSILAKSLDIPLLIGVSPSILTLNINDISILSTKNNYLNVKPSLEELSEIKKEIELIKTTREKSLSLANEEAITLDFVKINCLGNIANLVEAEQLHINGADGVGLFRTEFVFIDKDNAPSFEDQLCIYKEIIAKSKPNYPFVIRTLDIGGDKKLSYLNNFKEYNPVLGVRGIRLCLYYKDLFINQLKAILVQNSPNLKIMIPMVSDILEFREVKKICHEIIDELKLNVKFELGIMVEVPSVAIMSDIFAKEVDFFSIGTNDLTQYTLAIDRENSILAKKLDHLHPSVLRNIKLVIDGAKYYQKNVSVCGQMASEKMAIIVLIGLGIRSLSMNLVNIPDNKEFIRSLSYEKCKQIAENCLQLATANEVRVYLQQFVK